MQIICAFYLFFVPLQPEKSKKVLKVLSHLWCYFNSKQPLKLLEPLELL